ncbi:hypothetical protein EJ110_NYTH47883 [Nymphaea thermarum]|nr:hypothetical protein EJ110_NYTH47883 [Nymphaea thermarum]
MIQVMKGSYHYARVQAYYESEEEKRHRKAQFLIYKMMEKADSVSKRPPPLKVRVCRLRVKIGRKIRRLRNKMQFAAYCIKVGICGQLVGQLKMVKRVLLGRGDIATLSPASY